MASLTQRMGEVARTLDERFVGRSEAVRLLLVSLIAREHAVLIGPPGTAKSALVRTLAELVDARYFEYLLTRFTEPNEIFGPVDLEAFRRGEYRRRTAGMLPEAEVVFLDEIWKSNSAILNALLSLLNERRFTSGGAVLECPLISVFGASNEVPADETLAALFDRFLLRIRTESLDAFHFSELLDRGVRQEIRKLERAPVRPLVTAAELGTLVARVGKSLELTGSLLSTYKGLVFQLRAEGISFSDRRAVKTLKLLAASALVDGRERADEGDLFVLEHVWSSEDQIPLLRALVRPVVEAFHADHPERRRVGALGLGVEGIAAEIERIRQVLTGAAAPSDLQLFAQLKALGEIRLALGVLQDPKARALEQRVSQLLDAALRGSRFAGP